MVAESHESRITAFPDAAAAEEQGLRSLVELLASLVDAGGSWEGSQELLAARLGVSVRTVGRRLATAKRRGLVKVSGHGTILTYSLDRLPSSPAPEPVMLHPRAETVPNASDTTSDTSDTNLGHLGHGAVRGTPATSDTPNLARARGSSSSSSSDLGHAPAPSSQVQNHPPAAEEPRTARTSDTTSDTSDTTSDTRTNGGGGGDRLTPRGELLALFGVDVTPEMARRWAGFTAEQRQTVRTKFALYPPRKRDNPPPAYITALMDTAENVIGAEQLRELIDRQALEADRARVVRDAEPASPAPPPAPAAPPRRPGARALPRRQRSGWRAVLPWAATFAAGALVAGWLSRGGAQ